jgi:1-acyl-sn-glycerol-3-phosphate acyltransferase
VLTNDWVWKSPFYGYVIRHAEFYPVSWGIDVLLPKLESLVKRGYCIAVYPEGTRSRDCHIGRFHKGAFHIAKALQLDILPFVEYGAGFVLPKGGKYLRKGEIKLTIKDRIKYKEYMKIGTEQEISSWFKNYYVKEYSSLCNKLDQDA